MASHGSASRRSFPPMYSWSSPSPSPETIEALISRFPEVLIIPDSAVDEEFLEWSTRGLIGRSLGSWVQPESIAREIKRLPIAGDVRVIPLACRCYLLLLDSPEAREAVLSSPLSVNGSAFALAEWRPDFLPADGAISTALLWLRLPGLPIEYWGEEALRLIVAPAGEFVFSDKCTVDRQRGGFARVCIRTRIDLPLRPGVRVQGRNSVFWQQFAFENLQGIFPCCGSLHLSGSCPVQSADASSGAEQCFGPWMAALRLRISAAQSEGSPSGSGPSSAPVVASDAGWTTPKRFARRRAGPAPSPAQAASAGKDLAQVAPSSSVSTVVFSAPVSSAGLSPSAGVGRGASAARGRKGSRCSRGGKGSMAPPLCRHDW